MTSLDTLTPPARRDQAGLPAWRQAAQQAHDDVDPGSIDAYWRTLNYLSAAQLYLTDNPRLARPLRPADVKATPRGHWGVCPPVNWILAHLGPVIARSPAGAQAVVLHGAGHAGPAALAHAYLTGALNLTGRGPGWAMPELRALIARFPHTDRFGGEVTPLIPGTRYTGGQLGPALAVAQGMALDAPHRLMIPLIGDGELETGAAAASWLARRALIGTGEHGAVLPVLLANGLRMGGASLLAGLSEHEIAAYLTGLGYRPFIDDGSCLPRFRQTLTDALAQLRPLQTDGPHPVIVLTMPKGMSGPQQIVGRRIAGTPAVHKTPLADPRQNEAEFTALSQWLASYRPTELLSAQGRPTSLVRLALPRTSSPTDDPAPRRRPTLPAKRGWSHLGAVISERAAAGNFRLFSPDELVSNRIRLSDAAHRSLVEILNEEVCHAWLQGYTETGRDALLATYEAFAPINHSLLVQHLKHRALQYASGRDGLPSINYLLTSLGWRNTYTHQNPGLAAALLELQDRFVHVYTPADTTRAAAVLAAMLTGHDRVNLLLTDKHPGPAFPPGPFAAELTRGAAQWPHLSTAGSPEIALVSAGDIAAQQLTAAAELLATICPRLRLRYVHVNDLAVLGHPTSWPYGLPEADFTQLFGTDIPVIMATSTTPGTVRSLLATRGEARCWHVHGYQDPGRPLGHEALLTHCGMTPEQLAALATHLTALEET